MTFESIILNHGWDRSAWDLASLFLLSVGAELLGPDVPRVVGISEETTSYVSPGYFAEGDPFAGFIVHEAAHFFHNCKKRTIGLCETRTKEWLLDIEYRQRETFAYSCEAYARVLACGRGTGERRALAADTQHRRASRKSASTRPRSRPSSRRRPPRGAGGRCSSRGARRGPSRARRFSSRARCSLPEILLTNYTRSGT
ncbi:hypothetical protein [Corallococcus macrosporus]|uniref:hypothetical protein n=1 Tax=Corallococcus macrosporus TaxID=35 RepID=UPI000BB3967F|nr:hypothetical protein [Corallococcus macrosporus]